MKSRSSFCAKRLRSFPDSQKFRREAPPFSNGEAVVRVDIGPDRALSQRNGALGASRVRKNRSFLSRCVYPSISTKHQTRRMRDRVSECLANVARRIIFDIFEKRLSSRAYPPLSRERRARNRRLSAVGWGGDEAEHPPGNIASILARWIREHGARVKLVQQSHVAAR